MAELKQFNLKEAIPALSLIIDHQAKGNLYHGFRVAIIAYHLSKNLADVHKEIIFYGGLLHDIGLFETGEHFVANFKDLELQKTTPAFKNHPSIGAGIIKEIPGMDEAVNPIREHHEYFDGSGYPSGKRNGQISPLGQILRIADSFDLFLRQNNDKVSPEEIIQFVKSGLGSEFSPRACSLFLGIDKGIFSKISGEEKLKKYFSCLQNSLKYPVTQTTQEQREIFLKIFGRAIDGKHHYTNQHSYRVARYSVKIAKKIGLNKADIERVKAAGYLHDIGKIAIPNSILDKFGPLTLEEWEVVKMHPAISYEIVSFVVYFKDIAKIVFAAQEEYDGTGYPNKLKSEAIPLAARIIMVADAIDAMLSDRAYRKALSREKAIAELRNNAGAQFDPEIARIGIELLGVLNT